MSKHGVIVKVLTYPTMENSYIIQMLKLFFKFVGYFSQEGVLRALLVAVTHNITSFFTYTQLNKSFFINLMQLMLDFLDHILYATLCWVSYAKNYSRYHVQVFTSQFSKESLLGSFLC